VRTHRHSPRLRSLVAVAILVSTFALSARPASAACHSFTVDARPATVTEGRNVIVTVSRDNSVAPSQIDVSTIDGTAKAGRDYTRLRRTVSFTGDETERGLTISTANDTVNEPAETFRVHLSNPGGCAVNPNFQVGPDARVTIRDNDAPPPSPTTPPPTPEPTETETEEASPSPAAASPEETVAPPTESPTAQPSPTATPLLGAPAEENGGGLSGGAVAGIVAGAAVVIGAAAFALSRRRRSGPSA
jgi:hypothetical protein